MLRSISVLCALLISMCVVGCGPRKGPQPAEQAKPVQMTNEEMQAAWEKAGMVTDQHTLLKSLTGKYKTTVKMWMDPSAAPEVSKGTVTHTMVLGGRFLKEDYSGKSMGKSFQGMGLMGFDNVQGKYTSLWADSMSTAVMQSLGDYDPQTKTFTFHGRYIDPATREEKMVVSMLKVIDKNKSVFEMYEAHPSGIRIKTLEIEYARQG